MKWVKIAVSATVAVGIAIGSAAPSLASRSNDVTEASAKETLQLGSIYGIEGNVEMRQATPEEQRQTDIKTTQDLIPGISDADADTYNTATEAMSQLILRLETEQAGSFARAVQAPGAPFAVTVYFKNAPIAAIAMVKAAGIPNVTVRNDAKYTKQQQVALTNRPFDAIVKLKLTTGVSATYDWESDVITVGVQPKEGARFADIVSGAAKVVTLPGVLDLAGNPLTTQVVYEEVSGIGPAVLSGGTALSRGVHGNTSGLSTDLTCTAGFGVVGNYGNASGKRGILTAEHCEAPLAYEARLRLISVTIYDGSVRADARMFYTSADNPRRDFVSQMDSSRNLVTKPALATGGTYQGQKICVWGMKNGPLYAVGTENCSTVRSVGNPFDFCNDNGNCYQYYNQTWSQSRRTDRGDSGGPWFVGNTALGITSGSGYGWQDYSSFQPISDATRKTGTGVIVN